MTRDFRFSDDDLRAAVKAYGAESMRGQLALHCLELRDALGRVTTYLPFRGPRIETQLEIATEDARDLLRRRS